MAIDTESKRRSVGGVIFLVPDGTISASDRTHITWFYSGIIYAAISVAAGKVTATISSKAPGATITSCVPGATITSKAPGATIT